MSKLHVTNATWVWSDTHFGHHNIIQFQQRPQTHEIIMLSEWAKLVGEDDTILHLGDLHMRSNWNRWVPIFQRMPGRKFLILGNHDKHGIDRYKSAGFEVVDPFVQKVGKERIAFTHRPLSEFYGGCPEYMKLSGLEVPWLADDWTINVHGHIHANSHHPEDGSVFEGRRYINMSVEVLEFRPWQLGAILGRISDQDGSQSKTVDLPQEVLS